MRIRTQFIMAMLLFGAVLIAIGASAIVTDRKLEAAGKQENIAAQQRDAANGETRCNQSDKEQRCFKIRIHRAWRASERLAKSQQYVCAI